MDLVDKIEITIGYPR